MNKTIYLLQDKRIKHNSAFDYEELQDWQESVFKYFCEFRGEVSDVFYYDNEDYRAVYLNLKSTYKNDIKKAQDTLDAFVVYQWYWFHEGDSVFYDSEEIICEYLKETTGIEFKPNWQLPRK